MKATRSLFLYLALYLQSSYAETRYPSTQLIIEHECYAVGYDTRTKNPNWVYEKLTARNFGALDRTACQFKEDARISELFRATVKDYKNSGFDRGHLAPAANHSNSSSALSDTFYLSNISPQNPKFNRGFWNRLEKHVRELTKKYGEIEIFTGPLFLPLYNQEDGKRYITYQVIGENDVAVPTHFFKVIGYKGKNGEFDTVAYIAPNEYISPEMPLERFKTTIQRVEKVAGMIFFEGKKD